jgi:hypothetical protein
VDFLGYARRDVENAQREVNRLQFEIDVVQVLIDWCNNRPWYDLPAHTSAAVYVGTKLILEAAKQAGVYTRRVGVGLGHSHYQ